MNRKPPTSAIAYMRSTSLYPVVTRVGDTYTGQSPHSGIALYRDGFLVEEDVQLPYTVREGDQLCLYWKVPS